MTDPLSLYQSFVEACQRAQERVSADAGTSVPRTKLLVLLCVAQGLHHASQIATALGMTRQAIAQHLDFLETRELIWRSRSRDGKRALYIDLSERGKALVEAAKQ